MSLYEGVDVDGVPLQGNTSEGSEKTDISKLSGWSSSFKFMQAQMQRKKVAQVKPGISKSKIVNQVILDRGMKREEDIDASDTDVDSQRVPEPFLETEASLAQIIDEYDPLRPNEYEEEKQKQREAREREKIEERERDRDRDRYRDYDLSRDRSRDRDYRDRDRDRDRGGRRRDRSSDGEEDIPYLTHSSKRQGGAAIAPPPSLVENVPPPLEGGFQFGQADKPNVGFAASPVASQIMAKYGWKDGQGLGKSEQGMSVCLQVEKTSKRGGKIINQDKEVPKTIPEESITNIMKNPSKVVCLRNMVGPGDVDDELQPETAEECSKYGAVSKVIIYEIPKGVAEDEAVRIFVEFERMESAIKAVVDLNGRYFGGRIVRAGFYNLDRFRRYDLGAEL